MALLRYVASHHPEVGNDVVQAIQADIVLLVEDERAPSGVEQELLLHNVTVVRAQGDWASIFNKMGG